MEIATGEELILAMNAADPDSVATAASVMSIGLHKEIKVLGCTLKADREAFAWANVVGSNWVGLKIRGGYARITINDDVYNLYPKALSLEEMREKAAARNGVQSFDHTPKTHPQYKLKDAMEAFAKKLGA